MTHKPAKRFIVGYQVSYIATHWGDPGLGQHTHLAYKVAGLARDGFYKLMTMRVARKKAKGMRDAVIFEVVPVE